VDLFQAAVVLTPEKRAGLLQERCVGGPEWRAEGESLLKAADFADSLLVVSWFPTGIVRGLFSKYF
jgi:hypothetical protein